MYQRCFSRPLPFFLSASACGRLGHRAPGFILPSSDDTLRASHPVKLARRSRRLPSILAFPSKTRPSTATLVITSSTSEFAHMRGDYDVSQPCTLFFLTLDTSSLCTSSIILVGFSPKKPEIYLSFFFHLAHAARSRGAATAASTAWMSHHFKNYLPPRTHPSAFAHASH